MAKESVSDLGNFFETKDCEISSEFLNGYELSNFIEGFIVSVAGIEICEEPLSMVVRLNNKTIYKRNGCFLKLANEIDGVKVYFIAPEKNNILRYEITRVNEKWYIKDMVEESEFTPLTTGQLDNLTLNFLNFAKSY